MRLRTLKQENTRISRDDAEEIAEAFIVKTSNGFPMILDRERTLVKPYGFIFELKIVQPCPPIFGPTGPIFVDNFGNVDFLDNNRRDDRGVAAPRRLAEFLYWSGFEKLAYRIGF